MNILDEQILENQRQLLRSWRIPVRQIGYDIGRRLKSVSFGKLYKIVQDRASFCASRQIFSYNGQLTKTSFSACILHTPSLIDDIRITFPIRLATVLKSGWRSKRRI